MGRILTSSGGGGGISSSDVTAKSADVLAGTKTIMADSNDEVVEGEMINHGAISKVLKCGESITIPQGYHNGSGEISADSLASQTGGTATASDLYTGKTMVANGQKITGTMKDLSKNTSIQYASDNSTKVIAGDAVFKQKNTDNVDRICIRYNGENGFIITNTLFGIPSSNFGTVSTGNVLKGQTFTSSNGLKISGTMPDNSTRTSNGSVPGISSSYSNVPTREGQNLQLQKDTNGIARINLGVPTGYYPGPGNSYINRPASDFGTVAASNVRSGQTFTSTAGIKVTGTMSVQSAISFSAAATSYNTIRISWKNPAKGPWQGVFIQMSTSGNPGTGGGSRVYTGKGNSSSANASNYVDITGLNANTTYYFTCTSYVDNLGWGASYNVNCKTQPPSIYDIFNKKGINKFYFCYMSNYYYSTYQNFNRVEGNSMYFDSTVTHTSSRYSDQPTDFSIIVSNDISDTEIDYLNKFHNKLSLYQSSGNANNFIGPMDTWNKMPVTFDVARYSDGTIGRKTLIVTLHPTTRIIWYLNNKKWQRLEFTS